MISIGIGRSMALLAIFELIASSSKADFINNFTTCNDKNFDAHDISETEQDMIISEICKVLLSAYISINKGIRGNRFYSVKNIGGEIPHRLKRWCKDWHEKLNVK